MTRKSKRIDAYRRAAMRHGEATEKGKAWTANRAYARLNKIERRLRDEGPQAQRELLPLLEDDNPSVRLWAATDLLALEPDRASAVLYELARGPRGPVRLDAEMVLAQWENGEFVPSYE